MATVREFSSKVQRNPIARQVAEEITHITPARWN